jgi:hypothetical protein
LEGGRGEWDGVRLCPRKKKEKSVPMCHENRGLETNT